MHQSPHFKLHPLLSTPHSCLVLSLHNSVYGPNSPIFCRSSGLLLRPQNLIQSPITCARKDKRRSGLRRSARAAFKSIALIASNLGLLPEPLNLFIREFGGGNGGGAGIWRCFGGGGYDGWRRKTKQNILFVLLVMGCGLGLWYMLGKELDNDVLWGFLGLALFGVSFRGWKSGLKEWVLGFCCCAVLVVFLLKREEVTRWVKGFRVCPPAMEFARRRRKRKRVMLIDFCANSKSGNLHYAELVFFRIDQPSVYIWNSMIKGYVSSNNLERALTMYREMLQMGHSPDHFTFPFVLKACSVIAGHRYGGCVHSHIMKTGFESDMYSSTGLLHMYLAFADTEAGLEVFDVIPKWNVVAWSTLIAGYVKNNQASEAISVFKDMELWNVEPNEITIVNVLVACAQNRDIETGRWVHDYAGGLGCDPFQSSSNFNFILATAILDMYAKCGDLKTARDLFDKMPQRNLVAWNSMIGAYNQYRRANEVLYLFSKMQAAGFDPDKATFLSVTGACAQTGALALGQSFHAYVLKTNIDEDVAVGTALVDMYAKTGEMSTAWRIFDDLKKKDVLAWTSIIRGLAVHGHGEEALSIFSRMLEDSTVVPDHITYIGVLCACSHAGLVEEGLKHFTSMRDVFGIVPTVEHYGCMVDLLCRAGSLDEAEKLVEIMPIQPNIAIWGALLNGCKIHENVDMADRVRGHLIKLEPDHSGVYVLLSNVYAGFSKWQEVWKARDLMHTRKIPKVHGSSSVETKMLLS